MSRSLSVVYAALIGAYSIPWAQLMPGMTVGRGMLVLAPDSGKELKVTKEQNKKIQAAIQESEKRTRAGDFSGFDMNNPMAFLDPTLEEILTLEQKARLEELFIQRNGGSALLDKKVAAAMELTETQTESVKAIDREARPETMKLMMNLRSKKDADKLKEHQKAIGLKMLAVLTPEQSAKFEAAKGKPFKFKD